MSLMRNQKYYIGVRINHIQYMEVCLFIVMVSYQHGMGSRDLTSIKYKQWKCVEMHG